MTQINSRRDVGIMKVEPDSPDRCQATTKVGQCTDMRHNGSTYCLVHGGHHHDRAVTKKSIRNYQLAKWRNTLDRHTDSSDIKSLREEIGILRMMLESQLEKCNDDTDLLLASHQISTLVLNIEKLVKSCHTLEGSMGHLLDKQNILNFATSIVNIISEVLSDDVTRLTIIADRISLLLAEPTDASITDTSEG